MTDVKDSSSSGGGGINGDPDHRHHHHQLVHSHIVLPAELGLAGLADGAAALTIFVESIPCEHRVRARDREGRTVLHLAALKVAPAVFVEELIAMGADVNAVCYYAGNTALHLAAENRAHEHSLLLLKSGADMTRRNARGELPDLLFLREELPDSLRRRFVALCEQERQFALHPPVRLPFSRTAELLVREQRSLFSGDPALIACAARVARFEVAVPFYRGTESPSQSPSSRDDAFSPDAASSSSASSSPASSSPSVVWREPPLSGSPLGCWFTVIPRVCRGGEGFLVGGMCKFGQNDFQFDGLPFHLSDTCCLSGEGLELIRFISTTSTAAAAPTPAAATSMLMAAGTSRIRSPVRNEDGSKQRDGEAAKPPVHHPKQKNPINKLKLMFLQQQQEQQQKKNELVAASTPVSPPVVLELLTSSADSHLPTVVRCFRDFSGSVAALESATVMLAARKQQDEADEKQQRLLLSKSGRPSEEAQVMENEEEEEERRSNLLHMQTDKFRLRSLQMQAEGRAAQAIRRALVHYRATNQFRFVILMARDRMLLVKNFLRKAVGAIKFAEGVVFFAAAAFLRYAYEQLNLFPSHQQHRNPHGSSHCYRREAQIYNALTETVRSILTTVTVEKYLANSLLHTSVSLAFKRRQQRLYQLARVLRGSATAAAPITQPAAASPASPHNTETANNNNNSPIASAAAITTPSAASWRLLSRRERVLWCLGLDEVVSALVDNLTTEQLLPVITVAQLRDGDGGFLPRSTLYAIRQSTNPQQMFNYFAEAARSKAKRVLMDMTICFRGRKDYYSYTLQQAKEMNAALNTSEKEACVSLQRTSLAMRETVRQQHHVPEAMKHTAEYLQLEKRRNDNALLDPDMADPGVVAAFIHSSPFRRNVMSAAGAAASLLGL